MKPGEVTSDGNARVLADGSRIPMLGLGVWQVPDGPECVTAVRSALELGYRHIDTAQAYGNEDSVGRGVAGERIPREQVFITTKFYPPRGPGRRGRAEPAAARRRRGRPLHRSTGRRAVPPGPGPAWNRPAKLGYARSIGVSNFSVGELEELRAAATVAPAVNQVQFSPFEYRRALLEACAGGTSRWRPTAPSGPAGTWLTRRSAGSPASRADPGSGAAPLVHAATTLL